MADQLVEFLRARNEQAHNPHVDWDSKKAAWVHSVEKLYMQVREMLASTGVTVKSAEIEVTEEFIGTYQIPALELTIGNERVEFRPKGVNVIGAAGRVDIRGDRDTVTLIRNKADVDSGWSVVLDRVPRLQLVQLDRDSLKFALERVMLPLP